ncbi:MAG: carbohydrate kinase [Sulfuriferula multivorans]|uniref:Carbohydrate kinase n=1 Tax=Sulfuriferula multivorans TaxID=1559896 RepID=A0A7C9NQL0_9PROT|nr:carbohydrate kinase [Sulfuriferula multivorans]
MTQPIASSQTTPRSPQTLGRKNGTVVLFGEVLADIFPDRAVLGGAPFNVACHLKAFGQHPVLITRLGEDALRDEVMDAMTQKGLDTLGVQFDKHYPTGQVRVHIEEGGHRFEILPTQAYDFIHPGVARLTLLSAHPALVYFGTLAQRHTVSRQALKTLLRGAQSARFLDINLRPPWYDQKALIHSLKYAEIVKLNDAELSELASMFGLPGADPHEQAWALMEQFELEQVLVTRGDAGAWHMDRDGMMAEAALSNRVVKLVDTVGAGDGFASVFMLGSLCGWPILKTLERANTFAAAICEVRGAVPDQMAFYEPFKEAWGV